jgi:predicted nucleotidyltransferase
LLRYGLNIAVDKREAEIKAKSYVNVARDVVKFDKAILFGSYADGRQKEYSDIDIGLFVDKLDDNVDYLILMSQLYHVAMGVDVLIEPHLFIRSQDRSGFGAEVEKTGIVIEVNG